MCKSLSFSPYCFHKSNKGKNNLPSFYPPALPKNYSTEIPQNIAIYISSAHISQLLFRTTFHNFVKGYKSIFYLLSLFQYVKPSFLIN